MRDRLGSDVYLKVKQWQKETYTKQKLGGLKQYKEMDEGFTKVRIILFVLSYNVYALSYKIIFTEILDFFPVN